MPLILVVEDNEESLALMDYLLCCFGHEVLQARNGAEGLETARGNPPDLVIIDLQMPVMDGFELLGKLREDAHLRSIPTIAVTALAMLGDRDRVLAAGFDGYLSKPIDPATFAAELEPHLPPAGTSA
jgi:CheY-like chemotaxis protein